MRPLRAESVREEFEPLCAKLITCHHQGKKTMMMASCHEGEGTTTLAVSFSQTFVQKVQGEVLLVDANLHHPTLEKAFKVKGTMGLTDFISGEIELEAVIQETEITNLKILTAGNRVSSRIAIFNSEKFENCLEEFKKRFQFIIFDSAPILPYSDSLHLSSKVDVIILVIEAEKTRWEVVQGGIQKLENVGGKVFGTILNKKRYHIPNFVYKRL